MENTELKNAIQKLKDGDGISDLELELLLTFFGDLVPKLELMGQRYHFCWRDSFDLLERCKSFKAYRKSKK